MSPRMPGLEAWFVTGSQHLYGPGVLERVGEHARPSPRASTRRPGSRSRWSPSRSSRPPTASPRSCARPTARPTASGVIAWMHTFSPAKMWIAGLTDLRKPLVHLHTQFNRDLPWAEIDMDFMNLHQSAHGDREFAFIQTRLRRGRKTVVGHWQDPRSRRGSAGGRARRPAGTRRTACGSRASATTCARSRSPRATRSRPRRGSASRSTATASATSSSASRPSAEADVDDACRRLRRRPTSSRRRCGSGGDRHAELRTAARIEGGLRSFLDDGGFGAFTDTFEDLGGLEQLPGIGVQRLMADGYGFGAEGDWKAAALVRILKVMGDGLPGGTSFMEDYTYHLGDPVPEVLGAHMLEVCPSIAAGDAVVRDPPAVDRRQGPTRCGWCSTPRPGPAVIVGLVDLGDRFRLIANEVDLVAPDAPLPRLPVARAVWRPRPDLPTAAEAWLTAGGPHHTALTTRARLEALARLRRDGRHRARDHRRRHDLGRVQARAPLEPGVLLPRPRAVTGRGSARPHARRAPAASAIAAPRSLAARRRTCRRDRRLLGRRGSGSTASGRSRTASSSSTEAGNLANFRLAAGATGRYRALGDHAGSSSRSSTPTSTSGSRRVGWELGREPDAELAATADEAIELVAAAQRPTATSTRSSRCSRRAASTATCSGATSCTASAT